MLEWPRPALGALELTSYWFGKRWSAERIRKYQDAKLRGLVAYAYRNNEFYRRLWREAGVDPLSVRSVADLERLPPATKSAMQQAGAEELISKGLRLSGLKVDRTTGSTGNPMEVRRTAAEDRLLRAFRVRNLFDLGMTWRDRRAALCALVQGYPTSPRSPLTPWWMRLGALEYYRCDLTLGTESMLSRLEELRPTVVGGQASAMWQLALEAPREALRALELKFLIAESDTLTATMRRQIEEAFGCRVYNLYASTEFNLLATECRVTGLLHLNELECYVEVRNGNRQVKDGEEGEVFATNLHCRSMPFIRFRMGDWAVMGPGSCPCGAPFRTLREVHGRLQELIPLPDGRRVHPFLLINPLLKFSGWLGEFRVIHEAADRIRVPFTPVRGVDPPPDAEARIEAAMWAPVNGAIRIKAERVSAIPEFHKGKNRVFQPLTRD